MAEEYSDILNSVMQTARVKLVTYSKEQGIFITRDEMNRFFTLAGKEIAADVNSDMLKLEREANAKVESIQDELAKVNKMLKDSTFRENELEKDYADAVAAQALAEKENKSIFEEYDSDKKKYLDIISRYKKQVDAMSKSKAPLDQDAIDEAHSQAKEAQKALSDLAKEKNSARAEMATLKWRTASYQTALNEERNHFLSIIQDYENSLQNESKFKTTWEAFTARASIALNITDKLNQFWGIDKHMVREKAYALIDLARTSDPKNKLGARQLATLVFQCVKERPSHQRGSLLQQVGEAASAISLGRREEIRACQKKFEKLRSNFEKKIVDEEVEGAIKEDLKQPPQVTDIVQNVIDSKKRSPIRNFFLKVKTALTTPYNLGWSKVKTLISNYWGLKTKGPISRISSAWYLLKAEATFDFRKRWNQAILLGHKQGRKLFVEPYRPRDFDFDTILHTVSGIPWADIVKMQKGNAHLDPFSEAEWEILDLYSRAKQEKQPERKVTFETEGEKGENPEEERKSEEKPAMRVLSPEPMPMGFCANPNCTGSCVPGVECHTSDSSGLPQATASSSSSS